MNVIPLDTERYEESLYTVLQKGVDWVAVKKPEDTSDSFLIGESIKWQIAHSGSQSISPFSFNWNQYSRIYSLLALMYKYTNKVGVSSCRVDAIARDAGLVQLVLGAGTNTMVCAIEGVSERICNFVQKSLMQEELLLGLYNILLSDFSKIKLYYIYTGLETEQDLLEFEDFLSKLDEMKRITGKLAIPVILSFTPLLPSMGTPFQYYGFDLYKSLRKGIHFLHKVRKICASFGFSARLSSSVASCELAQLIEFTDRRSQPLLEYLSLVGSGVEEWGAVGFYAKESEQEVSATEYLSLAIIDKIAYGGKYYRIQQTERIALSRLYELTNAVSIYPVVGVQEMLAELKACHGKEISEKIISWFPEQRGASYRGMSVKLNPLEGAHFMYNLPDGRPVHHLVIDNGIEPAIMDHIKKLLPVFTNGITFNDLVADKDALTILPSALIKFHENKHLGQDFRQYLANRLALFDSYCFNDALARSLPKGVRVKVQIRNAAKGCGAAVQARDTEELTLENAHRVAIMEATENGDEVLELEISLEDLYSFVRSESEKGVALQVSVESLDGYVQVDTVAKHGLRPCLVLEFDKGVPLECSIDHVLEVPKGEHAKLNRFSLENSVWAEAKYLSVGDAVLDAQGGSACVVSTKYTGVKPVYDLEVSHGSSLGKHRFNANGISTHNCLTCGTCNNKQEIKHIIEVPNGLKETGKEHLSLLAKAKKDSVVAQKLIVEAYVSPGKYAAINVDWLRSVVTRAILLASDAELVAPLLSEHSVSSRAPYKVKQSNFKSLLSGSVIFELSFNGTVKLDNEYVEHLRARVNSFVTDGWRIASMRAVPYDFVLKSNLDRAMITYRFDSRKVKNWDALRLKKQIENFFDSSSVVKYKKQVSRSKKGFGFEKIAFDKSNVLFAYANIGGNVYESVLRVYARVEDVHPLIFLAGFLGSGNETKKGNPVGYIGLYGVDISIDGFYLEPETEEGCNLFGEVYTELQDTCPRCKGHKAINLMTGLPYGNAEYERDSLVESKYGVVCQKCYAELCN
jgi:hypothetical protein